MSPSIYVATRSDTFVALVQATKLGGFRLAPVPPARVRDVYWDTPEGDLLRAGVALRVRESDDGHTATIRPVGRSTSALAVPAVRLGPGRAPDAPPELPAGPLADAVARLTGGGTLVPLVALRQYRTPRVAYDGSRPALLLSLDVVVAEMPGAQVVTNEAEVDVTSLGTAADVGRLDEALRGYGLAAAPRSAFERALLRLPRRVGTPLRLLPDERARLDALAAHGDPLLRRRARVVLFDAQGVPVEATAAETGLSPARVRHWTERFAEQRMAIFEPEPLTDAAPDPFGSAPGFAAAPTAAPPHLPAPAVEAEPAEDDFDTFLDQFAPAAPVRTPHFAPEPDDEPDARVPDEETSADAERLPEPERPTPGSDGSDRTAEPPQPVLAADVAVPQGVGRGSAAGASRRERSREAPRPAASEPAAPEPAAPEPPTISGATSLIDVARAALRASVGEFEGAAQRLAGSPSPADARLVLAAAHRVRVAVVTFAPVLPREAAARLAAALRPLATALDLWLDLDRAAAAARGTSAAAALETDAVRARAAVLGLLLGARQRAWSLRAHRLLERLDAQAEHGLLVGDDFPPPPDDLVGAPGDVPVAARLRHVIASVLWARFEAIRAFEDDLGHEPAPEAAYHLAAAVGALRFALRLAARVAGPVGPLDRRLAAAEARLMAYRHARRTAALVVGYGGTPPADRLDDETVARVFDAVAAPDVRLALARIAAAV